MSRTVLGGYAGKFLRLDLSHERLTDVLFDEETLRRYVRGTGIGVKILYDKITVWEVGLEPTETFAMAGKNFGFA